MNARSDPEGTREVPCDKLTGHLGTLVRRSGGFCYEVRFRLSEGLLLVDATRDNVPVALDFNATVQEVLATGRRMYAHAVWHMDQGQLKRGA